MQIGFVFSNWVMATKTLRHKGNLTTNEHELTRMDTEGWLQRPIGKRRYVQNPWLFSKRAFAFSLRISSIGWTLSATLKPKVLCLRCATIYLVFKERGANSSLVAGGS